MYGVSYGRDAIDALGHFAYGLFGWLVVAPLAWLIPKRRDWIAVIGRADGRLLDNTKYFYLEVATGPGRLRSVHVTERHDVNSRLREEGLESLLYPTFRGVWFLARCGTVVVDSIEWCQRWRCFLVAGATLVQLWHGVGFKRIELDKWRNEARGRKLVASPWLYRVRLLRKWVRGRIPKYDAVVTTSAFYRDHVFVPAFRCRHVVVAGYPRNSFGQLPGRAGELAWLNVDAAVAARLDEWKRTGRRIVLVAPTFRDTRATPIGLDPQTCAMLDDFCRRNGYELLFKFHPYEHGTGAIHGDHLHVLDPQSDAYPLFPHLAAMVTDYSSIYMDFLHVDRPIVFLTPDLQRYMAQDRGIQFDFDRMTPGPKVSEWHEVVAALATDGGEWSQARAQLLALAFDGLPASGATSRLLAFMQSQRWLPTHV